MKLHLPHRLQAALMAAIASVSFTTVSSATLAAGTFAFFAGHAGAEDLTHDPILTQQLDHAKKIEFGKLSLSETGAEQVESSVAKSSFGSGDVTSVDAPATLGGDIVDAVLCEGYSEAGGSWQADAAALSAALDPVATSEFVTAEGLATVDSGEPVFSTTTAAPAAAATSALDLAPQRDNSYYSGTTATSTTASSGSAVSAPSVGGGAGAVSVGGAPGSAGSITRPVVMKTAAVAPLNVITEDSATQETSSPSSDIDDKLVANSAIPQVRSVVQTADSAVPGNMKNATWTFEGNMKATSEIAGLDGDGTYTWTSNSSSTPSYVASGTSAGDQVGNCYLTQGLGQAITIGANEYITVKTNYWTGGDGSLNVYTDAKNSYTVMAWVRFDSISSEQEFFGIDDNNGRGMGFGAKDGQVDALSKYKAHDAVGSTTVKAEEWANIAFSYDMEANTVSMYLNGEYMGEATYSSSHGYFKANDNTYAYIGASATNNADRMKFSGQIAELSILSGAYTQAEIFAAAHLTSASPDTLWWAGTQENHTWETGSGAAWRSGSVFESGADVAFIASADASKNVLVQSAITAGSVSVEDQYTFTLSGDAASLSATQLKLIGSLTTSGDGTVTISALSGTGALVKGDAGTMTLNGSNTSYTGNITVSDGVLKVGHNYALGALSTAAAGSRTITVAGGGTLDVNGYEGDGNGYAVILAGGTLTNMGEGKDATKRQLITNLKLTADSSIDTENRFGMTSFGYNNTTYLNLDSYTLEKKGSGTFDLQNTQVSGTGKIKVSGGAVNFNEKSGIRQSSLAANLEMAGGTVGGQLKLGSSVSVDTSANSSISAAIDTNGNALTFTGAGDLAVTGTISGSGNITKTGTGTLTLGGTFSSYSGNVSVEQGTLSLTKDNSLVTSGTLSFAENTTLDLSHYSGKVANVSITLASASGGITGVSTGMCTLPVAPQGFNVSVNLVDNNSIQLTMAPNEGASMHLYILTGQSNSLGSVKGSPAPAALFDQYASGGMLYNGNMHKGGSRYVSDPDWKIVGVQPKGEGDDSYAVTGPEYVFQYMMIKNGWFSDNSGDSIGVIKASLDGGGDEYWVKGGSNSNYAVILDTVKKGYDEAVAMGYDSVTIDGLLYLQGESNTHGGDSVKTNYQAFLSNLRADLIAAGYDAGKIKFTDNSVLGEPATWGQTDTSVGNEKSAGNTHVMLEELAASSNKIGFVHTRDLGKITSGDDMGVHYDGEAQLTIGARYAYAFAVQNNIIVGTVRGSNDEVALDQAGAWWMNALPAADSVAVWDLSSVSTPSPAVLAQGYGNFITGTLTVGGIRVEDVYKQLVTIKGGTLALGEHGIELQNGGLDISSDINVNASQTWTTRYTLAEGTTMDNQMTATGTIAIADGATLSIADNSTLTFNIITGTGNLTIGSGVTLGMSQADFARHTGSAAGYTDGNNGFISGTVDLVTLTGANSRIDVDTEQITGAGALEGMQMSLTKDGKTLQVPGATGTVYYVRDGAVVYNTAPGIASATAIDINDMGSTGATLRLSAPLAEGVQLTSSGNGGAVSIDSGVTLSQASLGMLGANISLAGSGTFAVTSLNSGDLPAHVALQAGQWTGTVRLANITGSAGYDIKLNSLGNANSTVEFEGVTAYLNTSSTTYNTNLKFTGTGLKIDAGNSNGTYTFNGSVSGNGTLNINEGRGSDRHTYVFAGDLSQWTGEFLADNGSKTNTVKFTGNAHLISADVKKTAGTLHLTVDTDATFNGNVTGINNLTLAAGHTATFKGTTNISGESSLGGTVYNEGDMTLGGSVAVTGSLDMYERYGSEGTNTYSGQDQYAGSGYLTNSTAKYYLVKGGENSSLTTDGLGVTGVDSHTIENHSILFTFGANNTIYYVNSKLNWGDTMGAAATTSVVVARDAELTLSALATKTITGPGAVKIACASSSDNYEYHNQNFLENFAGTVEVASGVVQLGKQTSKFASATLVIGTDGSLKGWNNSEDHRFVHDITLAGGTLGAAGNNMGYKGTFTLTEDSTVDATNTTTLEGTLSGQHKLTTSGDGTVKLSAAGSIGALNATATTVVDGDLEIGYLEGNKNVTVNAGKSLVIDAVNDGDVTNYAQTLTNSGILTLGAGVESLSTLVVNSGATLALTQQGDNAVAISNLTMNAGSILDVGSLFRARAGQSGQDIILAKGVTSDSDWSAVRLLSAPEDAVLSLKGSNLVLTMDVPVTTNLIWDGTNNAWDVDNTRAWHAQGEATGSSVFTAGANVKFESATSTATLGEAITAGTMTLESGANLTVDTNGHSLTVSGLTADGASLTKTGNGIMTIDGGVALSTTESVAGRVKMAVTGGELRISTTGTTIDGADSGHNGDFFHNLFTGKAISVTNGGKLVVDGSINTWTGTNGEQVSGVDNLEITGSVAINTAGPNSTYKLGTHNMKVGSYFWLSNKQYLEVAGGSLEVVGALILGHEDNITSYPAKLVATDSSNIKLHDIQFHGGRNVVDVNGSTLTFTEADANVLTQIDHGDAATGANVNTVTLAGATLVAAENSWNLSAIDSTSVTVSGDTSLEIGEDKAITIGGAAVSGSLDFGASQGKLVLNGTTVGAGGLESSGGTLEFTGTTVLSGDADALERRKPDSGTCGFMAEVSAWNVVYQSGTTLEYDEASFTSGGTALTARETDDGYLVAEKSVTGTVYYVGEDKVYSDLGSDAKSNATAYEVGMDITFTANGGNINGRVVILESGSTLKADAVTYFNTQQLGTLTLEGDANLDVNHQRIAVQSANYGSSLLDLKGNTLTVKNSGSGNDDYHFGLVGSVEVTAGTIALTEGVRMQVQHNGITGYTVNAADTLVDMAAGTQLAVPGGNTIKLRAIETTGNEGAARLVQDTGGGYGNSARTIEFNSRADDRYIFRGKVDNNITLVQNGTGVQVFNLTEASAAGAVTVNAGTLAFSGSSLTSTGVTVAQGGTIDIGSTMGVTGDVSVADDATLKLDGAELLSLTGTFTFNQGAVLDLSAIDFSLMDETVTLVTGGTIGAGVDWDSVEVKFNQQPGGYMLYQEGSKLMLTFSAADPRDLIWDNAGQDGSWTTMANWHEEAQPDTPVVFSNRDNVRFTAGLSPVTVELGADVLAGKMTIDSGAGVTVTGDHKLTLHGIDGAAGSLALNSTGLVRLAGASTLGALSGTAALELESGSRLTVANAKDGEYSGNISGSGTLDKSGNGVLVLSGSNGSYTGDIQINAGTLKAGSDTALGSTAANSRTIQVAAGAKLDVNGHQGSGAGYKIVLDGGTLTNTGSGLGYGMRQMVTGVALEKDSTIHAQNEIGITGGNYAATTLDLKDHILEKTGSSTLWLSKTTVTSSEGGAIKVSQGTLAFQEGGSFGADLVLAGGTVSSRTGSVNLAKETTKVTATANSTVSATLNTQGHRVVFDGSADLALTGHVNGGGTVEKAGSGTLTLTGGSSLGTSAVNVANGTLLVSSTGGLGTGTVTVADGATLVFDPALYVAANAASITLGSGATLTLGGYDDKALTMTGTLAFEQGAVLDISQLLLEEEEGHVKLTSGGLAAGTNLSGLTLSGYNGYTLSLAEDSGNLLLHYVNSSRNLVWNGRTDLVWQNEPEDETEDVHLDWHRPNDPWTSLAFHDYDNVTFNGTSTTTLGSDVAPGKMTIARNRTVTVNTDGHNFTVDKNLDAVGATLVFKGTTAEGEANNTVTVEGTTKLMGLTASKEDVTLKGRTDIAGTLAVTDGSLELADVSDIATMKLDNSSALINAAAEIGSLNLVNASTATVQANSKVTNLTLSGGSNLTNNALLAVENLVAVKDGTSVIGGTGTLSPGGIQLGAGSTVKLDGGGMVDLTGAMGITGADGSVLQLDDVTLSAGTRSWDIASSVGEVQLLNEDGVVFDTSRNTIGVAAGISGDGKLVKEGSGVLTLSGTNSYTGGTDVNEGSLYITSAGALTGNVTVATGASLVFADGIASTVGALTMGSDSRLLLAGEGLLTADSLTLGSGVNLSLSNLNLMSGAHSYTLATANSISDTYLGDVNITLSRGVHTVGTPTLTIGAAEGGKQTLVLTYDLYTPHGLIWDGGSNIWDVQHTDHWHAEGADPGTSLFSRYDSVVFENPTGSIGQSVAHVTEDVWATDMTLKAGTDATHKNVVTVDVANDKKLTVDFLHAEAHTGLVKTGNGSADIGIANTHSAADLTVNAGTLTVEYVNSDPDGMNITGHLVRTGGELNVVVGSEFVPTTATFKETSNISGMKSVEINSGSVVNFEGSVTVAGGVDTVFTLHDAEMNFISNVALNANDWVIQGTGIAHFQGTTTIQEATGHFNSIIGAVDVTFDHLTTSASEVDIRQDYDSSLHIKKLTLANSGQDTLYFTFQHTTEAGLDRATSVVDEVVVDGSRGLGTNVSSLAGLKEYQQGGNIVIKKITGDAADELRMVNYISKLHNAPGWEVATVFRLGGETAEADAFTGKLLLTDSRNPENDWYGTEDKHKQSVVVLEDRYVASKTTIDIKNSCRYSDMGVGVGADVVQVQGITDRTPETPKIAENKIIIFSGEMDNATDAKIASDDTVRTLKLTGKADDTAASVYSSSAGFDKNVNIVKEGVGTQVFKGDSSNFHGSIDVESGLLQFMNNASLNIEDLTLGSHGLGTATPESHTNAAAVNSLVIRSDSAGNNVGMANVSGTMVAKTGAAMASNMTIKSGSTLDVHATVTKQANLELGGSKYDMVGGLDMLGNTLTVNKGAVLSSSDISNLLAMTWGEKYELAYNISSLTLEGSGTYAGDSLEPFKVDASKFFENLQEDDYWVCYTGAGTGVGGNVGTFYIYKAPEPTTGTLSLLALAALCARRRRRK